MKLDVDGGVMEEAARATELDLDPCRRRDLIGRIVLSRVWNDLRNIVLFIVNWNALLL